jgi:hypothetical protein
MEKNNEGKGEFRNPVIYFSKVIATNKEPEDLLVHISHKWLWRGGIILKVKELQSFESETILCLFNLFPHGALRHPIKSTRSSSRDVSHGILVGHRGSPIQQHTVPAQTLPIKPLNSRARHVPLQQIELEGTSQQEGIPCGM